MFALDGPSYAHVKTQLPFFNTEPVHPPIKPENQRIRRSRWSSFHPDTPGAIRARPRKKTVLQHLRPWFRHFFCSPEQWSPPRPPIARNRNRSPRLICPCRNHCRQFLLWKKHPRRNKTDRPKNESRHRWKECARLFWCIEKCGDWSHPVKKATKNC